MMLKELCKISLEEQIKEIDTKITDLQERKKQLMVAKEREELRRFVETAEKNGLSPAELARQLLARQA
ncbi:hypothetical protein LXJ15735_02380 [Lacrimispora xylanolytica]|jgi:hypothetical protein|uniref:Uncharacterized protein n=1 Tax=Lacrimispora xylanolytica TaxID=29375 RepID=A0ABY7A926_9FIRM|nr:MULTISPECIES: hypothetical protein [Lacrimispora]WAJ22982.1 hypothetical protein OW255_15620 [Lacrimispora xylanolytica]